MKELSIEEKARRYDEAMKKAGERYNEEYTSTLERSTLAYVFPELKDSEGEKIRKWLIRTLKSLNNSPVQIDGAYEMMLPAIDWLEKQGEQKLNVNDNAKEMFIKALERVEEQNAKGYKLTDCDKNSWWEDFKAYTYCTIEQKSVIKMKTPEESLGIDSDTYNKIVDECIYGEQKPADKVEPKFKVGDYIKPIDKCLGSPRIIEEVYDGWYVTDKGTLYFEFEDNWELVEKPAWSKEDEKMIQDIINDIAIAQEQVYCKSRCEDEINWLKSLKDRVQSQLQWTPSDEQMKALADALSLAKNCGEEIAFDLRTLHEQLKKLREE